MGGAPLEIETRYPYDTKPKKKTRPKVYMEPVIKVPETTRLQMIEVIREYVDSDGGLAMTAEELGDHPGVDRYIQATLTQELEQYATELDAWNLIDIGDLRKILKKEYKIAEKRREQEEEALEQERAEAERVNKLEEERLRKEGRSLVVPLKDSNKAEALLKAAGINVKLLP